MLLFRAQNQTLAKHAGGALKLFEAGPVVRVIQPLRCCPRGAKATRQIGHRSVTTGIAQQHHGLRFGIGRRQLKKDTNKSIKIYALIKELSPRTPAIGFVTP
jgi:hypothetical protein